MRRIWTAIMAIVLLACGAAAAEGQKAPDYIMEGFDGETTSCKWETNMFFSRMQEKTGISFQFRQITSYDQWQERKRKIAAGTDLPDVLFKAELTPIETRRLYESGILINLRPYLEENAPALWALLQEHPEWMKAITLDGTTDGPIAALPAFNSLQNNDYMWINVLWLKTLGLEKPRTADELTTVLRAIRDGGDLNRNGQADEIPLGFVSMWELRFLAHAFGIIDNDYYVSVGDDGIVTSSLASDENRAFLAWLHQLWEENLLDHNGFNMADTVRQSLYEGKTVYGVLMAATPLTTISSDDLTQYEILTPLSRNGGQPVYRDLTGDVIRGTFAITRACPDPAVIVSWVDYLYTEEGSLLAQYGLEGEEYIWNEMDMWEWKADLTTVAQDILPNYTISSDAAAPGIALEDFQLKYKEDNVRGLIEMMDNMKQYLRMPFPYVTLSDEDAAELARIQADLMGYAETAMACFVTGDLEINDENWQVFCNTVHEKGLDEAIRIWQKYATKWSEE